ncbi:MAG: hypothetical protein ACKO0Z_06925 [Betaproteobacteria bacterium]
MSNRICVETSKLPAHIAAIIDRKYVEVCLTDSVTIGCQQWESGSRTQYHVASLDDSTMVKPVHDPRPWPQNMAPLGQTAIAPRCVVISTGTFSGKPATPYIYARPEDISPSLEAPKVELPFKLRQILSAVATYNSVGRKRFREDFRVSQTAWDSAIAELAAMGFCDKRGAITIEGRNAARQINSDITNPYSPQSKES